jgi:hypothetical protein
MNDTTKATRPHADDVAKRLTETTKTVAVVVLALLAVGLAYATRPTTPEITQDVVGMLLSPEFKDPLAARSMEIIDFDQDTGTAKRFKVAQVKGVWSLPSHFDYPADAQEQLASAASSLIDLKVLALAGDTPADHATFGVVDPATAEPGAQGVGKHVILADQNGKKLVDLIIGKEAKDNAKLRYVRENGKTPVYLVAVSTDKLTTRFDNWIEKDLLKLNSWDITRVFINNYSIDEANRRQVPGDVLDLTYNDKEGKWKLADLKEGEELDTTKLNELKTALDDLKIVDVRKKPAGLSRDLRTEEGITLDEQTIGSLISKGFYPTQTGDLLSNEGEVVAGTKEGVQYVLRFGEIALGTEQAADEEQNKKDQNEASTNKTEGEKKEKGANRYLFLMAQFDPALIEKPELEEVPGESQAQPPAEQPKDEGKKPADTKAEDKSEPQPPAKAQQPSQGPAAPEKAEAPQAEPSTTDQTKTEAKTEKTKPDEKASPAEQPKTEGDEANKQGGAKAKTPEEIERIKSENKRKQDEYNEKVKKGQEKVKELNDRFADWYYVISDDIYKKIHLNRADILKKPEAAKEAEKKDSPAEFEQLKQGIDKAAEQTPAAPK